MNLDEYNNLLNEIYSIIEEQIYFKNTLRLKELL
jgi:hypothetical protein